MRFKPIDYFSLVFAGNGVLLWAKTNNPLIALLFIIAVDFLGNWLTMIKSWRAPYSENLSTWIFMSVGSALGVLSVGGLNLDRLIFPVYVTIVNAIMVFLIIKRRQWRKIRINDGIRKCHFASKN